MGRGGFVISSKRVVVIGAGIGGLAAAVEMAAAGLEVVVLERAPVPGGKVRQLAVGGVGVNAGPNAGTMLPVFEALWDRAGERLSDHLAVRRAEVLGRNVWDGPAVLDLHADLERTVEAVGAFAGARDAQGYRALCRTARRIFEVLDRPFLRAGRPRGFTDLVHEVGLIRSMRLRAFRTVWKEVERQVQDPRLRQMFAHACSRWGNSPFAAPATMMLTGHLERTGLWVPEGGMHLLPAALAALVERQGATVRLGTGVKEITVSDNRATGVRLEDGEVIGADAVVMNGEPGALAAGLLGGRVRDASGALKFPRRSLSAATWAALARVRGTALLRHSTVFSRDYRQEFQLINAGMLPTEPTVELFLQDRGDSDGEAPEGAERVLIQVSAPASGDRRAFSQVEIEQCMGGIMALLGRCGVEMQAMAPPVLTSPATLHRLFPGSGGALYGPAVNGYQGLFQRPGARTKVARLFLAGGSTHPGPGLPMAALSGRQAGLCAVAELLPARRGVLGWLRRTKAS